MTKSLNTQIQNTFQDNSDPIIYVACLASYNSGRLHGVWIDATRGHDHIQEQVNEMLKNSPCEDIANYIRPRGMYFSIRRN